MSSFTLPDDAHPRVRQLYEYWMTVRGDRAFPTRADLDPIHIPRLLPFLTLVEVRDGTPRFVYRLAGTEATHLLRRDPTGKAVGTGVKPSELPEVLSRYNRVADEGVCIYQRALMQEEGNDYPEIDRLMLPLGIAPDRVTMILSLIIGHAR